MSRRRATDWIDWSLYRRAWVPAIVAVLVLTVTGFRPDEPAPAPLPPTFTASDARELMHAARDFDRRYPDRAVGTAGALDSAQWIRDRFTELGADATLVPGTTSVPGSRRPVSVVNVEALIRGRTSETVVVLAPRDTPPGGDADAVGTLALLALAEEISATQDRRRTYLLVSTDAGHANGAGARLLAQRLAAGDRTIIAAIALDRIGAGREQLRVSAAPAGGWAAPVGLSLIVQSALAEEGRTSPTSGTVSQIARLGFPMTLHEHGPLLESGIPTVTVTSDSERLSGGQSGSVDEAGDAVRAVQRSLGALDAIDAVQSAGKTWVGDEERVWRGWALKVVIAALLLPVWVIAITMVVRYRRRLNLVAASGSVVRAALAGLFSAMLLWSMGSLGLLPASSDLPPEPGLPNANGAVGIVLWILLSAVGWLLARGPDWRRTASGAGRDHATIAVSLVGLCLLAIVGLAVNPYAVLFAVPALHAWPWLASRRVFDRRAIVGVWMLGLVGAAACCLAVADTLGTGVGTAPWIIQLAALQGVDPILTAAALMGAAIGLLALLAALDRVHRPLLTVIRSGRRGLRERAGRRTVSRRPAVSGSRDPGAAAGRALTRARADRAPRAHRSGRDDRLDEPAAAVERSTVTPLGRRR